MLHHRFFVCPVKGNTSKESEKKKQAKENGGFYGLTQLPVTHVIDVDGQCDAGDQMYHSETQFEVKFASEGRAGPKEHQQGQNDVGHVRFDVDVGVTGVIQFQRAQNGQHVHERGICNGHVSS
jgi:hypothetical protein